MGLTSNKVLVLVILLAVLLFVGTVWWWPRLARRTWRSVSGRVGLLLATQVMLFASIGLSANQAFGFYASWADLLGRERRGRGRRPQRRERSGRRPPPGRGHRAGGRLGRCPAAERRPDQKIDIVGRTTRIATPAYVYLPPEYFQPRYRTRTFPAVTVLTGYPGTARALIKALHFPQTENRLVRSGRSQPMILVMLRPTVAPPRDTECVDIPGGPQTESFFAKDLPEAVSAHYRVGAKPRSWGIIGDSTGGYCALKLAVHHPGTYAAGAGLSPYYKAPIDRTTGDLFRGDKALRDSADLRWYLRNKPAPDTSLLVTSSKVGESNYRATLDFIDLVKSKRPTRISSIILDSGGHNFNTWRREIPGALQWLSGRLSDR